MKLLPLHPKFSLRKTFCGWTVRSPSGQHWTMRTWHEAVSIIRNYFRTAKGNHE